MTPFSAPRHKERTCRDLTEILRLFWVVSLSQSIYLSAEKERQGVGGWRTKGSSFWEKERIRE